MFLKHINITLFLLYIFNTNIESANSTCAATWTAIPEDVECWKVDVKQYIQADAEKACKASDPDSTLFIIKSQVDQDHFLTVYPTPNPKVPAFIGLKWSETDKKFVWSDGDAMEFQYFKPGAVLDGSLPCVVANVGNDPDRYWNTVPCSDRTLAVCQKQLGSSKDQDIIELKREYQSLKADVDKLKKQGVGKAGVPANFIYVQLPTQKEPKDIWPGSEWNDVSGTYANLFFRTVGDQAGPWDSSKVTKQEAAGLNNFIIKTKALVKVNYKDISETKETSIKMDKQWSDNLVPGEALNSMIIEMDGTDNHPFNTAVKIWQCTKGI